MKTPNTVVIMGRLFVCSALLVVGCGRPAPEQHIAVFDIPVQMADGARFKVETAGKFKAGFENNVREILIITDKFTGRKYIGITGVGISELRSETETRASMDGDGSTSVESTTKTVER